MPSERKTDLLPHPSTRNRAVRAIAARLRITEGGGGLEVSFRLEADVPRLRIPPPSRPRIKPRLWKHTCFETFVAIDGGASYHEFNFAPSGEWAAYAFRSYRDGDLLSDEALAPSITLHATAEGLDLGAVVRLEYLSPAHCHAPLRIGLSAVIEANDGTLSYWALRHPAAKPDFHRAEAFALRLEPPGREC